MKNREEQKIKKEGREVIRKTIEGDIQSSSFPAKKPMIKVPVILAIEQLLWRWPPEEEEEGEEGEEEEGGL